MANYTEKEIEKLHNQLKQSIKDGDRLLKKALNSFENGMLEEYAGTMKEIITVLNSASSTAIALLDDELKKVKMY